MSSIRIYMVALAGFWVSGAAAALAQGGNCKDPWINKAYNGLYHRAPLGSDTSGECSATLYGGGHWNDYNDLERLVLRYQFSIGNKGHAGDAPQTGSSAPLGGAYAGVTLDLNHNTLIDNGVSVPLSQVKLIGDDGASLTAQQAAAIVAQGGGNIVAQGGGNFHTMSVGEKKVYRVKKK